MRDEGRGTSEGSAVVESYRDLVAWQKAMQLAVDIYALTASLPEREKFGLISQLRRAAVSVPSALAEGHCRSASKDFMRFISIAMGSVAEVETQLMLCAKLKMLDDAAVEPMLQHCDEQNRIMRGLRKALAAKTVGVAPGSSRPSSLVSRP